MIHQKKNTFKNPNSENNSKIQVLYKHQCLGDTLRLAVIEVDSQKTEGPNKSGEVT